MKVYSHDWQQAEVLADAAFDGLANCMVERDMRMALVYARLLESYLGVMDSEERMGS